MRRRKRSWEVVEEDKEEEEEFAADIAAAIPAPLGTKRGGVCNSPLPRRLSEPPK